MHIWSAGALKKPYLLLGIQEDPSHTAAYRTLAACYAHMGRLDEAREIIAQIRTITPVVIPNFRANRNPAHRELFLSGLRIAMGETP
jgi:pentatricopeptide repeat protein